MVFNGLQCCGSGGLAGLYSKDLQVFLAQKVLKRDKTLKKRYFKFLGLTWPELDCENDSKCLINVYSNV